MEQKSSSTSDADGLHSVGYLTSPPPIFNMHLYRSVYDSTEESNRSSEGDGKINPELREKIMKQVEWYFSDENLLKDSYLRNLISRNREGYVSIGQITGLKKVYELTKDWKIVLESLRHSKRLLLNERETKVRRLSLVPQPGLFGTHSEIPTRRFNIGDSHVRHQASATPPSHWPCGFSVGTPNISQEQAFDRQRDVDGRSRKVLLHGNLQCRNRKEHKRKDRDGYEVSLPLTVY